MNYLEKTLSVLLIIVLAIAASAVMYGFIQFFFKALLWMMYNPIKAMLVSIIFVLFISRIPTPTKKNKNETLSK